MTCLVALECHRAHSSRGGGVPENSGQWFTTDHTVQLAVSDWPLFGHCASTWVLTFQFQRSEGQHKNFYIQASPYSADWWTLHHMRFISIILYFILLCSITIVFTF